MQMRLLVCLLCVFVSPTFAAEPLSVGVAVTEITPPLGYPMSGYFYERGATGTLDPLLAKAIVFQQGDVKAALVVGDMIGIDRLLADAVRARIEEQTGIPASHVIVSATHSHTGPNYKTDLVKFLDRETDEPLADDDRLRYIPQLIEQFAKAVANANSALKPMTLRAGSGHEDGVSFNRRFVLQDGTVRTWAKLDDPDVVKAAGPIDPEIGLITFSAEGSDKPSSSIVNFALHCDTVGGTQYSADYPGHIERVLRKDLGSELTSVFATAPCGDINHADPTGKPRRSAAEIGERIATSARKALPDLRPDQPHLAVKSVVVEVPLQTFSEADLAWADEMIAIDRRGEAPSIAAIAKAYKIRRLQRLRSGLPDLGREVDGEIPANAATRDSLPAEVQVIRLGEETALVALPGEVFVELGLAIKEASPFENTFVIELANDSPAYVPTRKAMEQGGYEANNSLYAAGGGELLVEAAIGMLKELAD